MYSCSTDTDEFVDIGDVRIFVVVETSLTDGLRTNVEDLWMLFVLLFLCALCLTVSGLLRGARLNTVGGPKEVGGRLEVWSAAVGIELSVLSWTVALVFVTPAGIVATVAELNLVMIDMVSC